MKELLKTLEQILQDLGAPVLSYFNPPMKKDEELISFVHSYWGGIAIPGDLIELYRWHKGTKLQEDMDVRPTFLADELSLCDFMYIKNNIATDEIYNFISDRLMPVFTSHFGEDLALDLKENNGKLIYCSTSDYEIPSMISKYDNLESLLLTTAQSSADGQKP